MLGSTPKMSRVVWGLGICVSEVPRECWCCGSQASISTQFNTALAVPSILEIRSCLHTFGMSFALSRMSSCQVTLGKSSRPTPQDGVLWPTLPCNNLPVLLLLHVTMISWFCAYLLSSLSVMCFTFTFSREMTLSYLSCYAQQQIQAQRNACWEMHDSILPKFQAPS